MTEHKILEILQLLKDSQQISSLSFEKSLEALNIINLSTDVDKDFDSLKALITHISLAAERVLNNQQITDTISEMKLEIESHPDYEFTISLLNQLQKHIDLSFNESESIMIMSHFYNMLIKNRGSTKL